MSVERDAFFAKLGEQKQERFEATVCRAILRGFGISNVSAALLEKTAERGAGDTGGFTPEWLSDHLGCPIVFRAVRDTQAADSVVSLQWLFEHRLEHRASKFWTHLWEESLDRYGERCICVCFKASWSSKQLCLHNYHHVLHAQAGTAGGVLSWYTTHGLICLQSLSDLLTVLSSRWRPSAR